jgi:hypothetical protein
MTAAAVGSGPRAGAYAYDSVAKAAPVSPQVTFLIRPAHIYDAHVHDVAAGVGTRDTLFAAEAGGDLAPAVIGENMARVRAAATDIGGVTYRATPGLSEADLMAENEAQIAAWKAEGRQIMDIGPAPNSPNHPNFPEISSPYYRMERAATDGYSGYAQLWIQEEGGLWP